MVKSQLAPRKETQEKNTQLLDRIKKDERMNENEKKTLEVFITLIDEVASKRDEFIEKRTKVVEELLANPSKEILSKVRDTLHLDFEVYKAILKKRRKIINLTLDDVLMSETVTNDQKKVMIEFKSTLKTPECYMDV